MKSISSQVFDFVVESSPEVSEIRDVPTTVDGVLAGGLLNMDRVGTKGGSTITPPSARDSCEGL